MIVGPSQLPCCILQIIYVLPVLAGYMLQYMQGLVLLAFRVTLIHAEADHQGKNLPLHNFGSYCIL